MDITSRSDTEIEEPIEDNSEEKTVTFKEALDMVSKLKSFNMSNDKIPENAFRLFEEYEKTHIRAMIWREWKRGLTRTQCNEELVIPTFNCC